MADLFLHLPFARRLRFAEGLHPLAGEAIGRRPSLVILGATLASLPGREREGMSWFRRLFSGGGEAARWQKLLAPSPGQPHVDLLVSILSSEEAAIGPMARFALGCGLLSHELLEEKLAGVTSSLQGPQKAAVERAQARLWLQSIESELKKGATLHGEWRPAGDFGEAAGAEAQKRMVQHVERALKRVYGSGPGESTLGRWLKALAAEVGPLADADRSGKGGLPPSLSMADADVRAAHFDQVAFVDKVREAQSAFVVFANRLAEAFTKGAPEQSALVEALGAKLEPASTPPDTAAVKARWTTWQQTTRDATMTRGRNPKPAFAEDGSGYTGGGPSEQRLASITKVMSLADLPPESDPTDAPPLPEQSGPLPANMPPVPPNVTQEISVAQIEAESAAFQSPPMTQEVSSAQIEQSDAATFQTPAHTQEVSTAQLLESATTSPATSPASSPPTSPPTSAEGAAASTPTGPPNAPPAPNNVTQPISAADIEAANAEDALRGPPPAPMTDPPQPVAAPTAPVSAEGAAVSSEGNGAANGVHPPETPPAKPPAQPGEPPRE